MSPEIRLSSRHAECYIDRQAKTVLSFTTKLRPQAPEQHSRRPPDPGRKEIIRAPSKRAYRNDRESITSRRIGLSACARAMGQAHSEDPLKLAYALESMVFDGPERRVWMRPEDHQSIEPLYLALAQLTKAGEAGSDSMLKIPDSVGRPWPRPRARTRSRRSNARWNGRRCDHGPSILQLPHCGLCVGQDGPNRASEKYARDSDSEEQTGGLCVVTREEIL